MVRDIAIQETLVSAYTLQSHEYSLPKQIASDCLDKMTSFTFSDLINNKHSSEYKKIKQHIYRSFLNKPLKPWSPDLFL